MKLKGIYILFILVPAIFFVSCLRNDTDVELSSNPNFVSLIFLRNDSIPNLNRAVFTLVNDSTIANVDSLPFNTRIDSVWPVFQFRSTFYARLFQEIGEGKSDTIFLRGNSVNHINDTINFTFPTRIQNVAASGDSSRTYHIKVNVHQVEPELYVWRRLNPQITTPTVANQRAVRFNNSYLFYVGTDTENILYVAEKIDLAWVRRTLSFTPAPQTPLNFRKIVENDNLLYVTDNENRLYRSSDGESWNLVNHDLVNAEIYNLLFSMNNSLWAITRTNTSEFRLAYSENGEQWTDWGRLPERDVRKFPIKNYAALIFHSPVGRPRVIIAGGLDKDGGFVRANWIGQVDLNNRMVFEPLRTDALSPPVEHAALIQYDNKILLFGGMRDDRTILPLLESRNEGLTWNVPDSAFNMLPSDFPARSYQSVIASENNRRFYLIGGRNDEQSFSDVWNVKLNRMYWQDNR